jgi:SAM-dependent methyltransferase
MTDPAFADSFDLYIHWELRLGKELPFLEEILRRHDARHVLDAGAGTGVHAAALAGLGFRLDACDIHEGVLEKGRAHARERGVEVRFFASCFTRLGETAGAVYDAVLCLGNSLCMVPDRGTFRESLASMASVLRPGGILVTHVINYAGLRARGKRIGPPRRLEDGRVVLKIFDLVPGHTAVNIVILSPEGETGWKLAHVSHPLLDVDRTDFEEAFPKTGLEAVEAFGGAHGGAFEPERSNDLFLVAKKA